MKMPKFLITGVAALAVVSTAASSFAQWDTLTATATGTVTIDKPITVTAETLSLTGNNATRDLDVAPEYTSTVTIKTEGAPDGTKLTLVPEVKTADGTGVTDKFTVELSGTGDNALTSNVDSKVDAENTYSVKVTPKDNAVADGATVYTVNVTATLSK